MPIQKSQSIILKTLPYRESSYILHLFSQTQGLVHGIAKGIRTESKKKLFLERGYVVESLIYFKPNRDLQIVSQIQVVHYFPSIRSSLIKTGVRDTAFETVLGSITASDAFPELFSFFVRFLAHLDKTSELESYPFILWLFFYRYLQYMGFALNLKACIQCKKILPEKAYLHIESGGCKCPECSTTAHEHLNIPSSVRSYLQKGIPNPLEFNGLLSTSTVKTITHLFADYCRYHFGVEWEYRSLSFFDSV